MLKGRTTLTLNWVRSSGVWRRFIAAIPRVLEADSDMGSPAK